MNDIEKKAWILLRRKVCRSRADLARALNISRPTASVVADHLLQEHAILEAGHEKITRGKAPTVLLPDPKYIYTVGLDLGYAARISGVLLDGCGNIVRKKDIDSDNTSLESIRNNGLKLFHSLADGYQVSGLGIALSAVMDPRSGKVINSINPLFMQNDLRELFSRWTALPVLSDNRSRLAAFSEACCGSAEQENNFILLSLGKSIGCSFWLDGKIFLGDHTSAGEIRSMRLQDGTLLENALSPESMKQSSPGMILESCVDFLEQLTRIMDIELLILTGRFNDLGEEFIHKLEKQLNKVRPCRVRASAFGHFSAARGIALQSAEKSVR